MSLVKTKKYKGIEILPSLELITFEKVKKIQNSSSEQARRKCFENSAIQRNKSKPTFSVAFQESIKPIYEANTGYKLKYSNKFKNYWHFVNDEEIEKIEEWEKSQGSRVFIRDTLSISIALSMYSTDPKEHNRTLIGNLVHKAKYKGNNEGIEAIAGRCSETIKSCHTTAEQSIYVQCHHIILKVNRIYQVK